ncbi:MAG: type II CAAX endopeptidase family protein [Deltaproteobacteria bacterium]|nr:type II CAAX endopeptidase family protein [Deltaproteobacteria bacterium]
MSRPRAAVLATLPVVAVLWTVMFAWKPLDFWLVMVFSQACMIAAAMRLDPDLLRDLRPALAPAALGLGSAAILYGVFVAGHAVSTRLLPFAGGQIADIYAVRDEWRASIVGALLFLVIGPGEEIYWRGLVQGELSKAWGTRAGVLVTAALYAGVHLPSRNFMLVAAALVCGLFWGLMYAWKRSLLANVVSHAVWDVLVMIVLPIR